MADMTAFAGVQRRLQCTCRLRRSFASAVLLVFGAIASALFLTGEEAPLLPAQRGEGATSEPASTGEPQEDIRSAAGKAFVEGEELRKQGSAESLRQAIEKYDQALPLLRAAGERKGEAVTIYNIGLAYDALGEKQKALDYYIRTLPLWQSLTDRAWEAATLSNIGKVHDDLGEKQKALDYYIQALPLWRAVSDRRAEATTLTNIAAMYSVVGEKRKALDYYIQALPLWQTLADRAWEATTLTAIGKVYDDLGQRQKALDYYIQALPLWRAVSDRRAEATTLANVGAMYSVLGEKQKALEYCHRALPLLRALNDPAGEAVTLNDIGAMYSDLGEKQKALDYYSQALPLWRAASNRAGEARVLFRIGKVYDDLGEKQKALDYYNQALTHCRALGDSTNEATTLNAIGTVYDDLGERQKALQYYNQALSVCRAAENREGEAATLDNILRLQQALYDRVGQVATLNTIGLAYDALGEKQKALDYYNQALSVCRAAKNRAGEATTLNNVGKVYFDLGEGPKAVDQYIQALPLWRAGSDRSDRAGEAATLNNIGKVFDAMGDKQKALNCYRQALALEKAAGEDDTQAVTLNNIGYAYSALSEKQKALDYYTQALPLAQKVGNRDAEAAIINNMGMIYDAMGDKQKALDNYNQALRLAQAVRNRDGAARTLTNVAVVERDQGKLTEARADMEIALKMIESLRANVTSQELRASYFATYQRCYEIYVDILMRLHDQHPSDGYDALALEASERGRARSLLETLTEAHAEIRRGVEPQLLQHEQKLQQDLGVKSAYLTRLMNGPHSPEQAAEAQKDIDDLLDQYQDMEVKIRTTSPHYAALTRPQPLSTKAIQQQVLDSDTLLLEYALGTDQSYLWSVGPDSLTSYRLPKGPEIESLAKDLYAKLTQTPALSADRIYEASAQLSQMVLGPVASKLGGKRLAIVADGALNYIPFGALPAPSDPKATGKQPPLVVNHEIVCLPSASTLGVLRRETEDRPPAPKLVAVMADPVFSRMDERLKPKMVSPSEEPRSVSSSMAGEAEGQNLEAETAQSPLAKSARESGITRGGEWPRLLFSRDQAKNIAKLVTTEVPLEDLDFAASKVNATRPTTLSQYRIVHFATHGSLDSKHPELSGVVLSLVNEQGKQVDGFLRLHDIFNLNLAADLVVLSACQTGLGKEVRGEGLVGLTRGFMYAGAPRVVVSLWSVNDPATAELMRRFYEAMLKDGQRPAQALRVAQIAMGNDPRWSAPYYWAAFVLQGDWR